MVQFLPYNFEHNELVHHHVEVITVQGERIITAIKDKTVRVSHKIIKKSMLNIITIWLSNLSTFYFMKSGN